MTSPLRLMLWLKWTLTWRGYRRSRSKVVGAVLFLVAFVPLSGLCAYGVEVLLAGDPTLAFPVTRDALALLYLLWVITPLLGFPLNESFNLTRLFVYPVSATRLFLGSVLGGLLDRSVLLIVPTLAVLVARLPDGPTSALLTPVLLGLFLLHTLALGQLLMLLLIGALRSRRYRDLSIILFPLFGTGYYLGQRLLLRRLEEGTLTVPMIARSPVWHPADSLPPGWAALGIEAARSGHLGVALGATGLLAAATVGTGLLAATLLNTLYRGDADPLRPRAASAPRPAATSLPRLLPREVGAVVWKEWAYFRRDPQYKALAVQTVYTLALLSASIALPSLRPGGWEQATPGLLLLFSLSGVLMLSLLPLLGNIWAGEGTAITTLFATPAPRRALLLGKNAAHGTLLLGLCAVGLTAAATLTHRWESLPAAAAWVLLATPLLLAAGNLISIRFPHRMLVRGQRWGRGGTASAADGGSGCAYSLLYLLAYGATFVALLPVLAAVLLPGLFGISAVWHLLTLPLAALYSAALYLILLRQAEVWLLAREPEIIARIVPE